MTNTNWSRRRLLTTAAASGAALGLPTLLPNLSRAQTGTRDLNFQLSFSLNNNNLGHIVGDQLGFFEEEGLRVNVRPGGPSMDGLAIVASGQADIGVISSSPSLMLATAQQIPVKAFLTIMQQHPYVFVSRAEDPIRTAADMVGRKIGVNQTGVILVEAILRVNGFSLDQVEIVTIGHDLSPLLTGQADAVTTWASQTTVLGRLGDIELMRLWDQGVQLYASVMYANHDVLNRRAEDLAGFSRALSRGWAYVAENMEDAVDIFCKAVPNMNFDEEMVAAPMLLSYVFTEATLANGFGTMDPAVWQRQIDLYDSLGQFPRGAPLLDNIVTMEILEATADSRAKITV
ncbi:MAG: ABC transporter substrate-binding protein [Pararhodobacter sp.]|nr:ABC transporter substrate-binding protein [Pararhodobacter sp.]